MNCEYCNRQLPPGAATCPSCGAEVPGGPVAGSFTAAAIPQSPGFKFQLQPGERLISEGSMQRVTIPGRACYMRLTDQRLVFCEISPWLTMLISLWLSFLRVNTISYSFTREDIVSMEVKPCFGRNKIVIRDKAGNKFEYAGQWFSNRLVQNIMAWWQGGI